MKPLGYHALIQQQIWQKSGVAMKVYNGTPTVLKDVCTSCSYTVNKVVQPE